MKRSTRKINYNIKSLDLSVSLDLISEIIANYYGIEPETIFVRNRKLDFLKIRYTFMSLAKEFNKEISYQAIGDYCSIEFGLQPYTHAAIMNARQATENFLLTDKSFKYHYESIKEEILAISNEVNSYKMEIKKLKENVINDVSKASNKSEVYSILKRILREQESPEELIA